MARFRTFNVLDELTLHLPKRAWRALMVRIYYHVTVTINDFFASINTHHDHCASLLFLFLHFFPILEILFSSVPEPSSSLRDLFPFSIGKYSVSLSSFFHLNLNSIACLLLIF